MNFLGLSLPETSLPSPPKERVPQLWKGLKKEAGLTLSEGLISVSPGIGRKPFPRSTHP